ncbi:radical SAM protein [Patescibacteria group bacterium]|nr:radical SAM protein [Patescibacteria group bacterium]
MISQSKIKESIFRIRNKIGLLEAPISVQWISTHSCNFSCEHCMVNAGKPLKDELAYEEIKKAIDDMALMGVKYFIATGGEPLLRKDIFEVLSYAKNKGLKIGLSTNCSLISNFKKELENLKLNAVMVSLDGLKYSHKKIRGKNNNFDNTINAIKYFKKIKTPKISVCTTVYKSNLKELEQLRDLIFSIGCNHWYINIILPEGRAKNKDWLHLDKNKILDLFHFIEENKKKYRIDICSEAGYLGDWDKKIRNGSFFCGCGWTSCAIMANGDIMACPIFEENDYIEGNIRKKSFKKIWEKGLNKFRNMKFKDNCYSCDHFSKCRGGCKVMRVLNSNCLKEVLEITN